jgi:fatty acid desaturase
MMNRFLQNTFSFFGRHRTVQSLLRVLCAFMACALAISYGVFHLWYLLVGSVVSLVLFLFACLGPRTDESDTMDDLEQETFIRVLVREQRKHNTE